VHSNAPSYPRTVTRYLNHADVQTYMLTVRETIELLPLARLPCLPAGTPLPVGENPLSWLVGSSAGPGPDSRHALVGVM
jgi:hypothetical protein